MARRREGWREGVHAAALGCGKSCASCTRDLCEEDLCERTGAGESCKLRGTSHTQRVQRAREGSVHAPALARVKGSVLARVKGSALAWAKDGGCTSKCRYKYPGVEGEEGREQRYGPWMEGEGQGPEELASG